MVYVHLVVFLSLVEYLVFVGLVGAARNKYDVPAPAMSGNTDFERILRVQQNTHEQLILFVPGIVGFAIYISPVWAASIGCVYLLGRVLYFFGDRVAAEKRTTGALMTLISNFVLVVGAVVGVILSLA